MTESSKDINLRISNTQVYLNGKLVAELDVIGTHTADDLASEVRRARALEALPKILKGAVRELEARPSFSDHILKTSKKKTEGMVEGFFDGLRRKTVPYPMPGVANSVPPIPPRNEPAYLRGYGMGDAIARCLDLADGTEGE